MLVVVGIVILGNLMLILMFNNPLDFRVYDFQKILVPYGNVLNFISVVSLIFVLIYGYNRIHMTNHFLTDVCFGTLITYMIYAGISTAFLRSVMEK